MRFVSDSAVASALRGPSSAIIRMCVFPGWCALAIGRVFRKEECVGW